jgi:hypothetical protein
VLLPYASDLDTADTLAHQRLSTALFTSIVAAIPDAWLDTSPGAPDAGTQRAAYVTYLTERLAASRSFVEEAQHARAQLV